MKKVIKSTRKTTESEMSVQVDFNGLSPDYRSKIHTPRMFLSHMLEQIAYRGCFTIETDTALDEFTLDHLVCEDLGMTFGKAIAEYIQVNTQAGIRGYGDALGLIDEAMATAALSFESRAYFAFHTGEVSVPDYAEDVKSEDLLTFLEGFCQGAKCTLHIDLVRGENAHHIFEAVFRSFGSALRKALKNDEAMKGRTAGVAGQITYETEVK